MVHELQELAWVLPHEAALLQLRQRLLEHDCEVTEIVDHGLMRSNLFH